MLPHQIEVVGQVGGRAEGVWMVLAQTPFQRFPRPLIELARPPDLGHQAERDGQVVATDVGERVVLAQDLPVAPQLRFPQGASGPQFPRHPEVIGQAGHRRDGFGMVVAETLTVQLEVPLAHCPSLRSVAASVRIASRTVGWSSPSASRNRGTVSSSWRLASVYSPRPNRSRARLLAEERISLLLHGSLCWRHRTVSSSNSRASANLPSRRRSIARLFAARRVLG